jgi:protein SCO1/2
MRFNSLALDICKGQHMTMSWRLASRLSVITLALLVVLVVALFSLRNNSSGATTTPASTSVSNLQGTNLGGTHAPDFLLMDQYGKTISLSQFKGKPVVLTFLYTHCPDVCPLTAEKIHTTMQSLGSGAQNVAVVAVSMDPKGDTATTTQNFATVHKLGNYFYYLIGTHNELAPVWASYSVDAQAATSSGVVNHSSAIYVIDKQGNERALLDNNFTPGQLASDLKTLLGE